MKKLLSLIAGLLITAMAFAQNAPEGLFLNSKAPDFKGKDQNGQDIRLKDLIKKGKVVLVFYRGHWDPYCMRYLKQLNDSLAAIKGKSATLVAITAETTESIAKSVEKSGAAFPILHDEELKIMKAYDVEYEVPANTITRQRNTGINLEEINGRNGNFLPITATYVIDKDQTVVYRFFNADYKKRAPLADILKALEKF